MGHQQPEGKARRRYHHRPIIISVRSCSWVSRSGVLVLTSSLLSYFAKPLLIRFRWNGFGGKVEDQEDPAQAARRELKVSIRLLKCSPHRFADIPCRRKLELMRRWRTVGSSYSITRTRHIHILFTFSGARMARRAGRVRGETRLI